MIPLRDNIPSKTFPFVNIALIAACILAFLYEVSLDRHLEPFLKTWGLVPARYAQPGALERVGPLAFLGPFVSSMFLHGGLMHILSNVWTLWIFGDNVEDRLGHFRYLLFYLACGLAAGLAQTWAAWGSSVPTIGASGAIAGVMGAYFVLFPGARVLTLVPIFVFLYRMEVPAVVYLGIWMWTQFYSGVASLASVGRTGGIAWWAHIGGFVAGILLLGLFLAGTGARRARAR